MKADGRTRLWPGRRHALQRAAGAMERLMCGNVSIAASPRPESAHRDVTLLTHPIGATLVERRIPVVRLPSRPG
jgi:hypothetical protein